MNKAAGMMSLQAMIATSISAAWLMMAPAPGLAADPAMLGLQKAGEGGLSFFGISLYNASLWTETAAGIPDPGVEPVLLKIDYERNINRDRLLNVTKKEWRRLDVADEDQRAAWLKDLERVLPSIQRGDVLSSLTRPGKDTRFYFAGEEIGRIEDPAFGEAFLAIWLDPRTRATQLRESLLKPRLMASSQTKPPV